MHLANVVLALIWLYVCWGMSGLVYLCVCLSNYLACACMCILCLSGLCCELERWRGCVSLRVYLAIVAVRIFWVFVFDLRKLRGGKGREGRVSPASGG